MKLTIGMATYDDYDGVYFTVQALRMYHTEVMKDVEILVVDNQPENTKVSEYLQCLLDPKKMGGGLWKGTYIPMEEPKGTTQPRNRIFEEASGDAVLVLDSHVLLYPGSLACLIKMYAEEPYPGDQELMHLFSGPLMYDNGACCGTQFDDVWRAGMWGIWAVNEEGLAGNKPFEIPGMGLGLFTCRKDAWLGFNPHFRGFGGEEMYIHEKYRQAGRRCLCLPWLKWQHRFGRAHGLPYASVATTYNKVRNYVLGHQELGLDLGRCWQHFVKEHKFGPKQWEYLVADPINHTKPYFPPGFNHPQVAEPTESSNTMKEMLNK